jgi:hypothetical protein
MTASYQPYQSLRLLCEARESLTNTDVLCESMIHTHITSPTSIRYTQYQFALCLNKAAQKYHAQQDGFVKGSQSMITSCSPLTNPLGMVWVSRFIKLIKHNERKYHEQIQQ